MSRSDYNDGDGDNWSLILWRGAVASAIRGKRGQAFLHEMLAAMDALPEPKLIADQFQNADGVCALGSVCVKRGIKPPSVDDYEDHDATAKMLGIAAAMVREIEYENDEAWYAGNEPPEHRFHRVRKWIVENLKPEVATP